MGYAPVVMSVAILALCAGCEPDTSRVASKAVTRTAVKKGKKFDREKWTDWQADNDCKGATWKTARYSEGRDKLDPNLTRDAVGFWVRRHEDGTAALWHKGLVRLRKTYESR